MNKIQIINHSLILKRMKCNIFSNFSFLSDAKYYIHNRSDCNFYNSYLTYILSIPLRTPMLYDGIGDIFTVEKIN